MAVDGVALTKFRWGFMCRFCVRLPSIMEWDGLGTIYLIVLLKHNLTWLFISPFLSLCLELRKLEHSGTRIPHNLLCNMVSRRSQGFLLSTCLRVSYVRFVLTRLVVHLLHNISESYFYILYKSIVSGLILCILLPSSYADTKVFVTEA